MSVMTSLIPSYWAYRAKTTWLDLTSFERSKHWLSPNRGGDFENRSERVLLISSKPLWQIPTGQHGRLTVDQTILSTRKRQTRNSHIQHERIDATLATTSGGMCNESVGVKCTWNLPFCQWFSALVATLTIIFHGSFQDGSPVRGVTWG